MANFWEPTPEQLKKREAWVESLPVEAAKEAARKILPWKLYRIKGEGPRMALIGVWNDGTCQMAIRGEWNLVAFERNVFGVNPDDLVECELPAPDELLGVTMNDEQTMEAIRKLRETPCGDPGCACHVPAAKA